MSLLSALSKYVPSNKASYVAKPKPRTVQIETASQANARTAALTNKTKPVMRQYGDKGYQPSSGRGVGG